MLFLQVRFISHMLDKHSAQLSKLPEFSSLTRDLRAFVSDNARNWEQRGDDRRPARSSSTMMTAHSNSSSMVMKHVLPRGGAG